MIDCPYHAIIVPLYGAISDSLQYYLRDLVHHGFYIVLVDNNPEAKASVVSIPGQVKLITNANIGGIAGGFNRGIESAIAAGAKWITLLDQDSRINSKCILRLVAVLVDYPCKSVVVGPIIWDEMRQQRHGRRRSSIDGLETTRLLISSGTTFSSSNWKNLGEMHEGLFIDFVDHAWCFRAQARGFKLFQCTDVVLRQQFGEAHPNKLCRKIGMQLYSPDRHFYSIRNLRWILLQSYIPLDLKIKELFKMLFKPFLWFVFEPRRSANLRAILASLLTPLPAKYE